MACFKAVLINRLRQTVPPPKSDQHRAEQRKGGSSAIMTPQAATLSDEDIADIAAYYSEQ